MSKSTANSKVDFFFNKAKQWGEELEALRGILLETGLTEELKWGCPCYTLEGNNIVLIHAFKEYCALLFFKGALLKDPKGILIQQTANVQAGRQIRFTKLNEIVKQKATIKSYVKEAVQVERSGLKVPKKTTAEYAVPAEFEKKLKESAELKKAFKALTPGRQRGYLLYFSSAKQSKTREERVAKSVRKILSGKGLDD